MQQFGEGVMLSGQERLFLSLAEQFTRPLLQLTQIAELAGNDDLQTSMERWKTVQAIAGSSLQLAESYALSLRVHGKVTPLELEPVTISSLLYDTAQNLQPFARAYGVELDLEPGPRVQPIIADRTVLQSALISLGQVFVVAQAETEADGNPQLVRLAAHRSRYGVVAGLYGQSTQIGADSLRRAQALHGKASEPLKSLVSGPAAGVFVADSLLQTLATRLHAARYRSLTGLAATLQPSQQMQLV
jgi:hypothetical protein